MDIITLINETFQNNLNPLNLESKIRNVGDNFTLKLCLIIFMINLRILKIEN